MSKPIQSNEKQPSTKLSKYLKLILTLSALLIVGSLLLDKETQSSASPDDEPEIPFCESEDAKNYAKQAFANGSLSQLLKVEIIDIRDSSQVGGAAIESRKCVGVAITNNKDSVPVIYEMKPEADGMLVEISQTVPLCDDKDSIQKLALQFELEYAGERDWSLRNFNNLQQLSVVSSGNRVIRNCTASATVHRSTGDAPLPKPLNYSISMTGNSITVDYLTPHLD